jgi:alkylation response protein AidB-like acyl-CoA dehydrogenase
MTDGAAFTLREIKREGKYWSKELEDAFARLTSNDAKRHWTSGQWMTEKRGGSDVSRGTDTFAIEDTLSGKASLYGYKWFSSATDADMTLALARFPMDEEELEKATGKLGLVFLKLRNKGGTALNNI